MTDKEKTYISAGPYRHAVQHYLKVTKAWYLPMAFRDHFGHISRMSLTNPLARVISPKYRFQFRLSAEVIRDSLFKERLEQAMVSWQRVREFQGASSLGVLQWW